MYRKLEKSLAQTVLETEVIGFWDNYRIFEHLLESSKNLPRFNFYEGPPTANGKPGVHHVIARTIKDITCRYKSMRGYFVERKAGWDTHGLPVEISVEKELGLHSKKDIVKYGIERFNAACKESVLRYLKDWEWMTRQMGYWLDMKNPYITYQPEYIETLWWIIAKYFREGYIYRSHKVLPYCARCGTGLSDHEVALGYEDVEDPSVYVLMKLRSPLPGEKSPQENVYFLVWTTTPWTLLSNVALAVHPNHEYILAEHNGKKFIVIRNRADIVLGEGNYKVIQTFDGQQLQGLEYEPLFRFVEPDKKAWYVIVADYVTTEDGTGIVHTAPAFGKEDFESSIKWDLPMIQLVDDEGKIKQDAKPFAGMWFKDADAKILEDLRLRRLLFSAGKIIHAYPFCWRCDSPLLQFARASWYIRTTAYKDLMISENEKIKWYPPQIGAGRFGEWLRNNVDWAISRERFWGTPLNIWICDKCGDQYSVESFEELRKMSISPIPENFDPHRPYVDEIRLRCPKCKGEMHRTPEVIDCWFDSGAMPFAQYHYPFGISEEEFSKRFPCDFISEAVDQTRGWFYTLLAISTFLKGVSSYKTCVAMELVLDKNGQKMSKSKNNVVDPVEVIEKYGADPLRWYFIVSSPPWVPTKFDEDGVLEVSRKFFDTLRNAYNFFALYADIDGFTPVELPRNLPNILDRWIISRLESLLIQYIEWMEDYQMTRAARAIQNFVIEELSNWYIRRSRRRFWGTGIDEDKSNAYAVLWTCLKTVCELAAPFAPMTAEFYWRCLTEPLREKYGSSVHLQMLPKPDESRIDRALEEKMELLVDIVELGRHARNEAKINIRQPLQKMAVIVDEESSLPDELLSIAKEELNVKEMAFHTDSKEFLIYHAKPNYKLLGRRFGPRMPKAKAAIEALSPHDLAMGFSEKKWHIVIDGEEHTLTEEDIIVETMPLENYVLASERGITIALEKTITPELLAEGYAREAINRIQNTRKEAGFDVTDRIVLALITDDENLENAFRTHKKRISDETLAISIQFESLKDAEYNKEWILSNKKIIIELKRA